MLKRPQIYNHAGNLYQLPNKKNTLLVYFPDTVNVNITHNSYICCGQIEKEILIFFITFEQIEIICRLKRNHPEVVKELSAMLEQYKKQGYSRPAFSHN